ncbi:MAG: DUF1566 domain-containing protein [Bdellovibrionaceae bacterium]|nr:DUF1566 domain-containing protein [Pseudobdellovibrionaceae bacterium]
MQQPLDSGASNALKYHNGSGWVTLGSGSGDLVSTNNLSELANAGTARTNLGLAIGTNVQAYDPQLTDVAALTPTIDNFVGGDGSNLVMRTPAQVRTSLGLGTAATSSTGNFLQVANNLSDLGNVGTARTNLGLGTAALLSEDSDNTFVNGQLVAFDSASMTCAAGEYLTIQGPGPTYSYTCGTPSATDATKLPLAGGIMTGPLVNNSNSASTALAIFQSGVGHAATFMGGNVGIGTASPTTPLYVVGDVTSKLSGTTGSIILTNSGGSKPNIRMIGVDSSVPSYISAHGNLRLVAGNSDPTSANLAIGIDNTGNVGIGTVTPVAPLDIAGDVKVGNSSVACTVTNKGSIRYNNASSVLEFCNGASWNLIQAAACSDATPDVLSFSDEANATTSALYTSDIIAVTGINCSLPVTISGQGTPQFQICSDSGCSSVVQGWTSGPSSVVSGQFIQARLTADSIGGSTFQATMIVGAGATVWSVTTAGSCVGSPAVGTLCADGTIYAGLSPDGNTPMYTSRCDAGQTWSGVACTGSRSLLTWNNGSTSWFATGVSNSVAGQSNSSALDVATDIGSPYVGASYCESLNLNGHTDWYLPSIMEVNILYSGKGAIKNFNTSGTFYWSSTEYASSPAQYGSAQEFNAGSFGCCGSQKNSGRYIRCVRK